MSPRIESLRRALLTLGLGSLGACANADSDADADYGECNRDVVDGLPDIDPSSTDGASTGVQYRYCVDDFASAEACMACDDGCFDGIAEEFFLTNPGGYYHPGQNCGPMWLDEVCCFQVELYEMSAD